MKTTKLDAEGAERSTAPDVGGEPETTGDWRARGALSIPEAGGVLGVGRSLAFDLARRGDLPTIRLGRRRVVPTHALRCLLGEA